MESKRRLDSTLYRITLIGLVSLASLAWFHFLFKGLEQSQGYTARSLLKKAVALHTCRVSQLSLDRGHCNSSVKDSASDAEVCSMNINHRTVHRGGKSLGQTSHSTMYCKRIRTENCAKWLECDRVEFFSQSHLDTQDLHTITNCSKAYIFDADLSTSILNRFLVLFIQTVYLFWHCFQDLKHTPHRAQDFFADHGIKGALT